MALTALALALPALASAEPGAEPMAKIERQSPSGYSFGFRVGGYGFRDPNAAEASQKWSDCRMNGLGLFGQKKLSRHAFLEAGGDVYFADNFPVGQSTAHGQPMDRLSGLLTAAAGLRTRATARLSAYAMVGLGVELTKVKIGDDHHHIANHPDDEGAHSGGAIEGSRVMPLGFIGFGADVRFSKRLSGGAMLRTYLMGHFQHGHDVTELDAKPEAANQGLFYLRYDL